MYSNFSYSYTYFPSIFDYTNFFEQRRSILYTPYAIMGTSSRLRPGGWWDLGGKTSFTQNRSVRGYRYVDVRCYSVYH